MNSNYRRYKVWFALKPANANVWLYLRTTTNGTPATTSAYTYGSQTVITNGTHTTGYSGGGAQIVLGGYPQHGINQQIHGELDFADCRSANWYRGTYTLVGRKGSANYESFHTVGSCNNETAATIDGFQFYFNIGSIYFPSRVFLLGLKGS
jgi:hypothetical protein